MGGDHIRSIAAAYVASVPLIGPNEEFHAVPNLSLVVFFVLFCIMDLTRDTCLL